MWHYMDIIRSQIKRIVYYNGDNVSILCLSAEQGLIVGNTGCWSPRYVIHVQYMSRAVDLDAQVIL